MKKLTKFINKVKEWLTFGNWKIRPSAKILKNGFRDEMERKDIEVLKDKLNYD